MSDKERNKLLNNLFIQKKRGERGFSPRKKFLRMQKRLY